MLLVMIFMLMFNAWYFFWCVCVWSSEFCGRIDANIEAAIPEFNDGRNQDFILLPLFRLDNTMVSSRTLKVFPKYTIH